MIVFVAFLSLAWQKKREQKTKTIRERTKKNARQSIKSKAQNHKFKISMDFLFLFFKFKSLDFLKTRAEFKIAKNKNKF